MSNPANRPRWWGYVKNVIRAYPELHRELEELHTPSLSAGSAAGGGHSGNSRPVEQTAVRTLSRQEQKEHDAVESALIGTELQPDGQRTTELVRLVCFRQSHTLYGAAMYLHISNRTANRRMNRFIWTVAKYMGLD